MALQLVSVEEAAERLRVSPYTIRHWARQRRFQWFKLGTRMVIDVEDLERYVTEQKRAPLGNDHAA
jgi:excisionase family DNA binding protein